MGIFKKMDALLSSMAGKYASGMGCAIARNGEMLYEGYFGLADEQTGRKIDRDTTYRQYSLTKIAIYTACMMLFEQGHFLLNEPLYEYFPEWKDTKKFIRLPNGHIDAVPVEKPILVKDIMRMTCGLPYGRAGAPDSADPTQQAMNRMETQLAKEGPFTLREEIRRASQVPIAFEPGTHFLYGFGSELAAGLVEVITGKRIWEALDEMLFKPLEMKSTGMHYFGDAKDRLAVMYDLLPDGTRRVSTMAQRMDSKSTGRPEDEAGCPRLFSTVPDFINLSQMLANGGMFKGEQIMGRKTIDLMRANQLTPEGLKDFRNEYLDGYGYGLGVRTLMSLAEGNCNSAIGEFGWTGGSGTWVSMDPSTGVSVVYMHQLAPNMEYYHHLRVRACAYGCID